MNLDELANLVRKTAKELNLTLDKICVFHGERTMDFKSKKPKAETGAAPHVYCELVDGLKVRRMSMFPDMTEDQVRDMLRE